MQSLSQTRLLNKSNTSLHDAIQHGCHALIDAQKSCGCWEDYQLPVGKSDQWVTAYVGLALAEAYKVIGDDRILVSACKALDWLLKQRRLQGGIGYNGSIEADADSTAQLVLFTLAVGGDPLPEDLHFLHIHQKPDGGFTTFRCREDAWGQSHPCVTGVVARALTLAGFPYDNVGVHRYLSTCLGDDGLWPSYWWLSPAYASFFNMLYLSEDIASTNAIMAKEQPCVLAPNNIMDLALCLGLLRWIEVEPLVKEKWLSVLLSLQNINGLWPSSRTLRVTNWECYKPWEQPEGKLYEDELGLMTTATVIRILSLFCHSPRSF